MLLKIVYKKALTSPTIRLGMSYRKSPTPDFIRRTLTGIVFVPSVSMTG